MELHSLSPTVVELPMTFPIKFRAKIILLDTALKFTFSYPPETSLLFMHFSP